MHCVHLPYLDPILWNYWVCCCSRCNFAYDIGKTGGSSSFGKFLVKMLGITADLHKGKLMVNTTTYPPPGINIQKFHATTTMLLHYLIKPKHSPGRKQYSTCKDLKGKNPIVISDSQVGMANLLFQYFCYMLYCREERTQNINHSHEAPKISQSI